MNKLKDKYNVEHIEAGHTPDGYTINEVIQLEDRQNRDHRVEVYKGGAAAYYVGVNEASSDKQAYQDMGIDTDSKEFKDFEAGLQKDENYNDKYIKDFLENAPELTAEKRQEIDKQRDISVKEEIVASNEYEANGGFLAEMEEQDNKAETEKKSILDDPYLKYRDEIESEIAEEDIKFQMDNSFDDREMAIERLIDGEIEAREIEASEKQDLSKGTDIVSKEQEYAEQGKTEVAKPGRTYTGNVIEVGEDVTVQQTKTGKFIIHETENLPGIKEQDTGMAAKIIYDAGGKGDITAKSNDLSIGKEKEKEADKSHEKSMER